MNSTFKGDPIDLLPSGKQSWQAPSNIALIKYWGKYGTQLPKNTSLSFTLQNSRTTTEISYEPLLKKGDKVSFEFLFEGKVKSDFHPKLEQFFTRILPYQPFLKGLHLQISSSNSFPHSSGIASSASAYAALSACLVAIEASCFPEKPTAYWNQKMSFLARLGSGSAARSISGPMMLWGAHTAFPESANEYAIPFQDSLHACFQDYQDCILLVDKGQKKVSSTLGHGLMENHAYATARFEQAQQNTEKLAAALVSGDLTAFIQIVESEALTLHAMMQTSNPYFILMRPNTLHIIEAIWSFREVTDVPLCFTLDAGANVHLLYPKQESEKVLDFIQSELVSYCQAGEYILDCVGQGAKKS